MTTKTLVTTRIILYSLVSLGAAWTTSMNGVFWKNMGWEEQSCLIFGIFVLWGNSLIAFFDKSMWKLDQENTEKRLSLLNGVKPE